MNILVLNKDGSYVDVHASDSQILCFTFDGPEERKLVSEAIKNCSDGSAWVYYPDDLTKDQVNQLLMTPEGYLQNKADEEGN